MEHESSYHIWIDIFFLFALLQNIQNDDLTYMEVLGSFFALPYIEI